MPGVVGGEKQLGVVGVGLGVQEHDQDCAEQQRVQAGVELVDKQYAAVLQNGFQQGVQREHFQGTGGLNRHGKQGRFIGIDHLVYGVNPGPPDPAGAIVFGFLDLGNLKITDGGIEGGKIRGNAALEVPVGDKLLWNLSGQR